MKIIHLNVLFVHPAHPNFTTGGTLTTFKECPEEYNECSSRARRRIDFETAAFPNNIRAPLPLTLSAEQMARLNQAAG